MSESLLQLGGAPPNKQYKNIPLSTSVFFSGLWTQRSPFGSPDSRYYTKFLGGRTDIMIDGSNVELTNYGTLIRRPGNTPFTTVNLGSVPLTFYSFHQFGNLSNPVQVIADTATTIYSITPTTKTSVMTKSVGSGQSYFQGIGNTLYIGDGVDQQAWPGSGNTRNWGIAMSNPGNATGPNACGTGSDVAAPSGTAWANPGNITANDGVFATVTLAGSGSSNTAGPNFPASATGNTNSVGGGSFAWSNPANIEANDGVFATCAASNLTSTDDLIGTSFGFSIPATASIVGILLEVNSRQTAASTIYTEQTIELLKGGVTVGSNKANPATGPGISNVASTVSYGGSSDLWGTTWTPSDINSSGFGAVVVYSCSNVGFTVGVDFFRITITYTLPGSSTTVTDILEGTNFGFSLSTANTISGILVEIKGLGNAQPTGTSLTVQMLKAGTQSGTAKTGITLPASNNFISLGGSGDLWGTTFSAGDANSTGFGVSIQGINTSVSGSSGQWSVDFVRITVFGTGGPTVSLVTGSLTGTFQYVFAYCNSNSTDVSNPTPPSASISPAAQGVQIGLTASTDTQVNQIRVFRTKTGPGSTFFELPTSPYPNTTANVTDNATDGSLNTFSFFTSSPWVNNNPPPAGLVKMTYHLNRMWGVVNNFVYFSALLGDDITVGLGVECWPPANVFPFPTQVNRLVPIASGLLVFTTDDVYLITGTSRTGNNGALLTSILFQQGVGLLSWNALDIEGNQMFLYTSDRQFISFSASGPVETGFAIGVDLQNSFDPAKVYVAALIAGTQDKAVFLGDGSASWYRCNWNQPPEGGPSWSPKASVVGGVASIVSVETSPGTHQLLVGQSNGTVLARNYSAFSDNGSTYSTFATIGSLVLAKPGQLAALNSIVLELKQVGSAPTVSLLLDEIGGSFETLVNSVNDPPKLTPSQTVMSRRWYLSQGGDAAWCRHIQLKISWGAEAFKNELLTVTAIGALTHDE